MCTDLLICIQSTVTIEPVYLETLVLFEKIIIGELDSETVC